MSDVLRSFTTGTSVRKRRRELRRRAGRFGGWVLFAAAALLVAAWWTTRDTFAMGGLVPKDAAFQASVDNVMKKRALLAQSQLWELLPEESAGRGAVQAALSPAPLPEWLLNNLSSDISFWSSPRLDDFSELLVVSKMTRVGCLAVKLARFLPGIGRERAGGVSSTVGAVSGSQEAPRVRTEQRHGQADPPALAGRAPAVRAAGGCGRLSVERVRVRRAAVRHSRHPARPIIPESLHRAVCAGKLSPGFIRAR